MHHRVRPKRSLVSIITVAVAIWVGFSTGAPALEQEANAIYTGGDIITINDSQPSAEAIAIKDGKILAVGAKADVLKHKGSATKMVDLGGKTLLPGFIDAHGHVFNTGLQALAANLLAKPDGTVNDIAALQQTLRDWATQHPERIAQDRLDHRFRLSCS
ncbi:MAG: amidohydrolase family protein [Deltaproteobacteria bacterium]|nr:amidohydrolase family protein [Deltaproteobacteria bacterium]